MIFLKVGAHTLLRVPSEILKAINHFITLSLSQQINHVRVLDGEAAVVR